VDPQIDSAQKKPGGYGEEKKEEFSLIFESKKQNQKGDGIVQAGKTVPFGGLQTV
jgi:hypothetical protein